MAAEGVNAAETLAPRRRAARWKLYLALSRTPHGLLDMAAPFAAALLWLGRAPSPGVGVLGVITVFAAYTAVYAVNDLVDFRTDRDGLAAWGHGQAGYLDAVFARHPLAQGLITWPEALAWTGFWGLVALLGAYILNPACAGLILFGAGLEAVYCGLLKITHLRALVNGAVKTLGGVGGILAVDPKAPWWFLGLYFVTVFAWEIGGQNIPADWFDLDTDRTQGARTMPVALGTNKAARIALGCQALTALGALGLLALSPAGFPSWLVALGTGICALLLVLPAWRLNLDPGRERAATLFNLSSYFPVVLLGLTVFWLCVRP